jgi:hypothetical protein
MLTLLILSITFVVLAVGLLVGDPVHLVINHVSITNSMRLWRLSNFHKRNRMRPRVLREELNGSAVSALGVRTWKLSNVRKGQSSYG